MGDWKTTLDGSAREKQLGVFLDPFNAQRRKGKWETGFAALDKTLGGGLCAGLHCLGAASSLGKSTFSVQMADMMAAKGYDIIYFSLEMNYNDINAKSISRKMFELASYEAKSDDLQNPDALRAWDKRKLSCYTKAVDELMKTRGRLFVVNTPSEQISAADVKETVKGYIEAGKQKPVIIIDYLQFLKKFDDRLTDKQNMDKNIIALKETAATYDVPIFLISSLSRSFYKVPIDMASFKESGIIEYTAETVIGLQYHGVESEKFDAKKASAKPIRDVELVVLKNRFGATGTVIPMAYRTAANHFREEERKETIVY